MNGADYIAVVRLTGKSGKDVKAAPGETCEKVDPRSLPWLVEQGLIVPKPEAQ
jgi:hypothetical protein